MKNYKELEERLKKEQEIERKIKRKEKAIKEAKDNRYTNGLKTLKKELEELKKEYEKFQEDTEFVQDVVDGNINLENKNKLIKSKIKNKALKDEHIEICKKYFKNIDSEEIIKLIKNDFTRPEHFHNLIEGICENKEKGKYLNEIHTYINSKYYPYSLKTILNHLNIMVLLGILNYKENSQKKYYSVNKDFIYSVGIYIGTKHIFGNVVNYRFEQIKKLSMEINETDTLENIKEKISEMLNMLINTKTNDGIDINVNSIGGVTISCYGIVNYDFNTMRLFNQFYKLGEIKTSDINKKISIPENKIFFTDHMKSLLLSELYIGTGRISNKVNNSIIFHLSSNIHSGIIINKKLHFVKDLNNYTNLNHMILHNDSKACTNCDECIYDTTNECHICGKTNCLFTIYKQYLKNKKTTGEKKCDEEFYELLAYSLGIIYKTLSPSLILFTGTHSKDLNIPKLEEKIKYYISEKKYSEDFLVKSNLTESNGVLLGTAIYSYLKIINDKALIEKGER